MAGDYATTGAVSADELRVFCLDALTRVGMGEEDAQTTADVLVTTDTWGVFTHGVKSLPAYIRRIRAGGIRADARPRVTTEGSGWAIVDGDSALGMVASTFAMRVAIEKARACGIGYAGVFNSCHFGAAGYYAAMAAEEDMIGMAMANDTPSVTAPGARGRVTGSNPLAYAVPTGSGMPIVLDMATSTVAGGKVAAAHALGKLIPGGWVIDALGQPTTDPGDFLGRRRADPDGRAQGLRFGAVDRDVGRGSDRRGDHTPGRPVDRRRPLDSHTAWGRIHRCQHRGNDANRRVQRARRCACSRDP